jgi:c-di-GMP phosphodiesterase
MNMTNTTQDPVALPDIFIGRQPIYDRQLRVIGYELLYRSNGADRAEINNADFATSQVVLNAFAEMGLDRIVGNKKAFINLTKNFFLEKYPIPFLPDQVVLEIPENTQVDEELTQAIKTFKQRGFQIALDDVSLVSSVLPLLKLADIVKMNLIEIDRQRLPGIVTALRKSNILLLAEKVETRDEFNLCNQLGFDYFQGYFLCRPETIQSKKLPTSRMVILQLINKIQNPYVDFKALEEILAQDVILSYKLLRLVNSSYYSPTVRIDSIQQAVS